MDDLQTLCDACHEATHQIRYKSNGQVAKIKQMPRVNNGQPFTPYISKTQKKKFRKALKRRAKRLKRWKKKWRENVGSGRWSF